MKPLKTAQETRTELKMQPLTFRVYKKSAFE